MTCFHFINFFVIESLLYEESMQSTEKNNDSKQLIITYIENNICNVNIKILVWVLYPLISSSVVSIAPKKHLYTKSHTGSRVTSTLTYCFTQVTAFTASFWKR